MKNDDHNMYSKRDEDFFAPKLPKPKDDGGPPPPLDAAKSSRTRSCPAPGDFPMDAFPSVVQDMATELSRFKSLGLPALCMSALAVLSGVLGNSLKTKGADSDEATPVNLIVLICAATMAGKGGIRHLVESFFECQLNWLLHLDTTKTAKRLELDLMKRAYRSLLKAIESAVGDPASQAALIEAATASNAKRYELQAYLESSPSYIVHRTTGAKLRQLLAQTDGRCFMLSLDGAENLLRAFNGADTLLRDLILSGFSNERFGDDTATRGDFRGIPCVSGLYAIQPIRLRQLLFSKGAAPLGLTNRITIIDAAALEDGPKPSKGKVDQGTRDHWAKVVTRIFRASVWEGRKVEALWDGASSAVFDRFENEMDDIIADLPDGMRLDVGRCREFALRIGGILWGTYKWGAGEFSEKSFSMEASAVSATRITRWLLLHRVDVQLAHREALLSERLEKLVRDLRKSGGSRYRSILKDSNGFDDCELDELLERFPSSIAQIEMKSGTGPAFYVIKLRD